MKKTLIVESKAKARTIEYILGKDFQVLASNGHVRDLPEDSLGIKIDDGFKPQYTVLKKSKGTLEFLKKMTKITQEIYLATDPDREGEAIAWHLKALLRRKKDLPKFLRITFHEITDEAVKEALKKPYSINQNLVDAQQARRVLDRLVGYKLSPFLWEKVKEGLSAGRVQTVALRLVVEREKEREQFKPTEFWKIAVLLKKKDIEASFKAELFKKDGKVLDKLAIKTKKEAKAIEKALPKLNYKVKKISFQKEAKYPFPPFITSSLQQEASWRLWFSPRQTMRFAQSLYEKGLITYHRTDSYHFSNLALNSIRKYIEEKIGKEFLPETPNFFKTKSRVAQEAHEAIRPTYITREPETLKGLQVQEKKLYELIWRRTLACQMKPAELRFQKVEIEATPFIFLATALKTVFAGWQKVYLEKISQKDLPPLKVGEKLLYFESQIKQDFTEPPPRFSEAGLIKTLEELGIGRPSTYAPTVSTLFERGYVSKIEGKLVPEEIGKVVAKLLVQNFPEIFDYQFTAKVEDDLDKIANQEIAWQAVVKDFYQPFEKKLAIKNKVVKKVEVPEEKVKAHCPKCDKQLSVRHSRFGKFLACSGFPQCRFTAPFGKEATKTGEGKRLDKKCPRCGKTLVVRRSRFGYFVGCEGYPACEYREKFNRKA